MGLRYTIEQLLSSYNKWNRLYEILEDIDERLINEPRKLRHIFAEKNHLHDDRYARKNHNHDYDYKYSQLTHSHSGYLKKNETAMNSMQLAGHPITDFASIHHSHSFMVLASETTYTVTATNFTLQVKLQLSTTLERVSILNSSNYPEVTITSIDGNIVTLQCEYGEDQLGQEYHLTLLYYNINTKYLSTVLTVDDVYGCIGDDVSVTSYVTDENGNPFNEGTVEYTLSDEEIE